MKMLAELAQPPREMTFLERWFTSNPFLLGTQLFNIALLPYLLEGIVMIVQHPSEEAGYMWLSMGATCKPCPSKNESVSNLKALHILVSS